MESSTYYEKNKERILQLQRERRQIDDVKQKQREYAREYYVYQDNKNRIKQKYKEKVISSKNNECIRIEKKDVIIYF